MQLPVSVSSHAPWFNPALNMLDEETFAPHERVSELVLRGFSGNCLQFLAPILRELNETVSNRWLTLIAPPEPLTRSWLRENLNDRERILVLHPKAGQTAHQLACEALRLGNSHTVLSWLNLDQKARLALAQAADDGSAQSLNIRLA